jgi:hypothetical protein
MVEMSKLAGANSPTTNAELVESLRLGSLAAPGATAGGHDFCAVGVLLCLLVLRLCVVWSVAMLACEVESGMRREIQDAPGDAVGVVEDRVGSLGRV